MKKFIKTLVYGFLIFLFGALIIQLIYFGLTSNDSSSTVDTSTCEKPIEIPDTFYTGDPIHWDCTWQASYVNGLVTIKYDSITGGVEWLARTLVGDADIPEEHKVTITNY